MTIAVPVELATFDAAFGTKTAVSRSGDVEAANEVWQVAAGFDGVMDSATQPAIGVPPSAKLVVPDGEPAVDVATANNVTPSFVTAAEGNGTSDRMLPLAVWTTSAWTLKVGGGIGRVDRHLTGRRRAPDQRTVRAVPVVCHL